MINESHQIEKLACTLSGLNDQFRAFVEADPRRLQGLNFDNKKADAFIDNFMPDCISPWPMFIASNAKNQASQCAVKVPQLVEKLIKHQFDTDAEQTSRFYGVERSILQRTLAKDCSAHMFCRADMIYDGSHFKVLELNMGSNLGGWDIRFYDEIYRQAETFKQFLATGQKVMCRDPLKVLVKALSQVAERNLLLDETGACNLLFIVDQADLNNQIDLYMRRVFGDVGIAAKVKVNCHFCADKSQLQTKDGKLYYQGKPIAWMMTLNEDVGNNYLELDMGVLSAFFAGKLMLPENPVCQIIGDKRNLGLLWQHKDSGIFDDRERQLIEKHIPWSVSNEQQQVEYQGRSYQLAQLLENHQHDLVIKAGRGFKGNGVYVGRHCEQEVWHDAIKQALNSQNHFVIQQHIDPLTMYVGNPQQGILPCQTVWGAFAFAGSYGGIWTRHDVGDQSGCNGVINSANGAQESIVYEDAQRNSLSL